jgi:hypothetical protein
MFDGIVLAALATGALLLSGPLSDDRLAEAVGPAVAELEAIGIVSNGELVPWAAQHLLVMLAPDLHVEAAVTSPAGEVITRFWARADAVDLASDFARRTQSKRQAAAVGPEFGFG